MLLTDDMIRLPISSIFVDRPARQRTDLDGPSTKGQNSPSPSLQSLRDSISRHGQLQPIIVDHLDSPLPHPYILIAGERRLTACTDLGHTTILCRFLNSLDETSRQLIELEENIKRKDLPWIDIANAAKRIHTLLLKQNPSQTQADTANFIGISESYFSMQLKVMKGFEDPRLSERLSKVQTIQAAYGLIDRRARREGGDALEIFLSDDEEPQAPIEASSSILNADFLSWIETYQGPRFNLIHCDFPYGLPLSLDNNKKFLDLQTEYSADDEALYFRLLSTLCRNYNKIMANSSHLLFWFSMKHQTETMNIFRAYCPDLTFQPYPLIWHKSDNAGMMPSGGPRHIYETCLMATRHKGTESARSLVSIVSDVYSCPTASGEHPSCKPEPMLRHFFSMLVDDLTTMLDPTCGSGTAIRAAESLGAKTVLGLEINPDIAETSTRNLQKWRNLRFHL